MIKNYLSYIKEGIFSEKNVGDIVYVFGTVDSLNFKGQRGRIVITKKDFTSDLNRYDFLIEFDEKFSSSLHDGQNLARSLNLNLTHRCYYVAEDVVKSEEEMKELLKKREEGKEKHKDIDPYGEEEWYD